MIKIYGASDDLIEIDGDICEEFYALPNQTNEIICSDGTVIALDYGDEGSWTVSVMRCAKADITIRQGTAQECDYSQVATLDDAEHPIEFVAHVLGWAKRHEHLPCVGNPEKE